MSRGLAARVIALAESDEPRLGSTRLVCIDGPAGSGKTTLATDILALAPGTTLVHVDELVAGWRGLPTVQQPIGALLAELARDRPGTWRRFDWPTDSYAEEHTVEPTGLLVLEGCGSGGRDWARWTHVLVWMEATDAVRLRRGLARDGEHMREQWLRWMDDEAAVFAREETRSRADVVVAT